MKKKLVVADLSNIEGRVLSWIAGEKWKLQAFRDYDTVLRIEDGKKIRKGPDLYNVTAVSILGGDPWTVSKKNRNVFGKVPDLASGYQGGVAGYQTFARAYGVRMEEHWETIQDAAGSELVDKAFANFDRFGYDQLANLEISEIEWLASETCKLIWRKRHPATTAFWYNLQDAMITCIRSPGIVKRVGQHITVKCTKHKGQTWLLVKLPSGRYLTYFKPELRDGKVTYEGMASEDGGKKIWTRIYTHGGKATGNCLGKSTRILTSQGVKSIVDVRPGDLVWDGVAWVATDGVAPQGRKVVGTWLGISITSDHLITDGRSWKPAMQLDACFTHAALSWAASSVLSPFFVAGLEIPARPPVGASVVTNERSACDNFGEDKVSGAASAPTPPSRRTVDEIKTSSRTMPCGSRGQTDTNTWCGAAPTHKILLGRTTEDAASQCTPLGLPTDERSFDTCSAYLVGTSRDLISTDGRTTADTCPATCGSCLASSIPTTKGPIASCPSAVGPTRSLISGEPIAPAGAHRQRSRTTSLTDEPQTGLWQDTTRAEEVFDLLNCGPRNRFTVITDEGPVVVHNCCQAIARDVLAPRLMEAEQLGYIPVLSVHDEALTETPDTADFTAEGLVSILSRGYDWSVGLPLAAEGFETYRYYKE